MNKNMKESLRRSSRVTTVTTEPVVTTSDDVVIKKKTQRMKQYRQNVRNDPVRHEKAKQKDRK